MSLIIATGSNLGDKKSNLQNAKKYLTHFYALIGESQIYQSDAVDYTEQPFFFNQVLEFEEPKQGPSEVMEQLLAIENMMGRRRSTPKGPRIIDLDLIFFGHQKFNSANVTLPHPRWDKRDFVYVPLKELPFSNCSAIAQRDFPQSQDLIRV